MSDNDIAMSMVKPVFKELAKPKEAKKKDILLNKYVKEALEALTIVPIANKLHKETKNTKELAKDAAKAIVDNIIYPNKLIENSINKGISKKYYGK